jgi:arabinan endo-1,5-alpha-L-arabinosidase
MTYGSWSGGIFVLEIDEKTGKAIYPGKDGKTEDGRMIDRYFGTKIAGGYTKSGEGPYIVYDKNTDYFYLYVTYGWLGVDGGYNMRQFRSKNPDGPYLDASGQDAVLPGNVDHTPYGNKIMGNFLFERKVGDPGTGIGVGYMSPGHNSVSLKLEKCMKSGSTRCS